MFYLIAVYSGAYIPSGVCIRIMLISQFQMFLILYRSHLKSLLAYKKVFEIFVKSYGSPLDLKFCVPLVCRKTFKE